MMNLLNCSFVYVLIFSSNRSALLSKSFSRVHLLIWEWFNWTTLSRHSTLVFLIFDFFNIFSSWTKATVLIFALCATHFLIDFIVFVIYLYSSVVFVILQSALFRHFLFFVRRLIFLNTISLKVCIASNSFLYWRCLCDCSI